MKFLGATFLFLILNLSVNAQRDYDYSDAPEEEKKERVGYQAIIIEFLLDPVKGLDALSSNEYPEMNQNGSQFRLRYGFGKRKLSPIIDLSYYFRNTSNSLTLYNSASIRSFGIGIGHDFNLINGEHFFLKPMYLINFTWYKINFTENLLGDNLADILNSDYKEFTFRSFQVPVQLGLNTGFKFKLNQSDLGFLLGAGYILNYDNSNWKIGQENRISDNINLSSFYLTAALISNF